MAARVIVLWGKEEITNYYDYSAWSQANVCKMLKSTKVYEFANEDEAEAFRLGMCEVATASARDFVELSPEGFKSLKNLSARRA